MRAPVIHLVVGPERHGVVRFGVELTDALRARGFAAEQRRTCDPSALPPGCGVHIQFTDRLFGDNAEQAATAVAHVMTGVRRAGGRVSVTLHDLPQPSDGANFAMRARAYASLAESADAVVVSSNHERNLLSRIHSRQVASVIPLPITPASGARPSATPSSVAVFGFLYPGKGHAEVLDAMSGLPGDVRMVAIGEPSAGHEDLVDDLERVARGQGRRFDITGHVPDDEVPEKLRAVTVPVVHPRHVSASASLNSWLAAGRRPLVADSPYVREIAERNAGALWVYDNCHEGLSTALRAALDQPTSTWAPPGAALVPTADQVAVRYSQLLTRVHR